jgi:CO dehydrogenase/acetyl-CoA synthase gamma subunit (corrinoid Fe-S protein)
MIVEADSTAAETAHRGVYDVTATLSFLFRTGIIATDNKLEYPIMRLETTLLEITNRH